MKIVDFEIINYRSCLKTKFQPNPDLTALIGVNGSGKSSILNAMLLLKKSSRSRPRPEIINNQYVSHSSVFMCLDMNGKKIKCKGEIYYETSDRNIDEVLSAKLKWNLKDITGINKWVDLPLEYMFYYNYTHRMQMGDQIGLFDYPRRSNINFANILNISKKEGDLLYKVTEYLSGINYYSASQFSDPTRCPVSIELEDHRLLEKKRSATIDHMQFIYDLYQSRKTNNTTYKRFLNIVGENGIQLVKDIEFDEFALPSSIVEIKAGGKAIKREKTRNLIVPIFTVDNNRLSPNQLSEGTFKTLALLFYVITDKSDLLLIEEPEVCIHHGLLNSIITLVKKESKDKQIIITTHSDYVLDQLAPENVVIVKKGVIEGTTAKPITKSLSKKDFKALKEYLEEAGNLGEYWREGGLNNEEE